MGAAVALRGQFERKTAFYVRLANGTREISDQVERQRYIAGRWTAPAASPEISTICGWRVTRTRVGRMLPGMSEPAPHPIEPPPLTPAELAEIRAVLEQVARGDYSGTIPWEEVAKEFDLPSSYGS
jgi:hypothetical protein